MAMFNLIVSLENLMDSFFFSVHRNVRNQCLIHKVFRPNGWRIPIFLEWCGGDYRIPDEILPSNLLNKHIIQDIFAEHFPPDSYTLKL